MESAISNQGSVEDIRCALSYYNPTGQSAIKRDVDYLKFSLEYEKNHLNRKSVVVMIESKLKKLVKLYNSLQ